MDCHGFKLHQMAMILTFVSEVITCQSCSKQCIIAFVNIDCPSQAIRNGFFRIKKIKTHMNISLIQSTFQPQIDNVYATTIIPSIQVQTNDNDQVQKNYLGSYLNYYLKVMDAFFSSSFFTIQFFNLILNLFSTQ